MIIDTSFPIKAFLWQNYQIRQLLLKVFQLYSIILNMRLSPAEQKLVLNWIEERRNSGHWGNGMVTTPDEELIQRKIGDASQPVIFSDFYAHLLITYAEDSRRSTFGMGDGTSALSYDEYILLKRLYKKISASDKFRNKYDK
jgi:hypothetical protein